MENIMRKEGQENLTLTWKARKAKGNVIKISEWMDDKTKKMRDHKEKKVTQSNLGSCGDPWSHLSRKNMAYKRWFICI